MCVSIHTGSTAGYFQCPLTTTTPLRPLPPHDADEAGERQPAGAGNGGLLGRQWTRFAAAHTADEDKLRAELALVMAPKPSGRLSEMMVYI